MLTDTENDFVEQINWHKIRNEKEKEKEKLYKEEILPLNQYIKTEYNATDNVLVTICKQHEEYYDAIVTCESQPIEYIQITCAIDGASYAIGKEVSQDQNTIHNMQADIDDPARKAYDKNLSKLIRKKYGEKARARAKKVESMHSSNDIKKREIKLIKEAIDKKTKLQKKCYSRTLLVVYYADGKASYFSGDHFNTTELNALSKYCNDNRKKLLDSAFQKVVIVNKEYYNYRDDVPKPIELWRDMTHSCSDAPTTV